jgi:CHASE3 domain sensor protein
VPTQSPAEEGSDPPFFRYFPRCAGAAVTSFGLLVVASWHAHWQRIIQMVPNSAPMQYNTALCFALLGVGLILLTTRRARYGLGLGALVALLALATLLQYFGRWDLGIDQFFFRPFFEAQTAYPGRMSPLAAVCFTLSGAGIAWVGAGGHRAHRHTVSGALACIVGIIALVALYGFAFGFDPAYSWGSYSRMALNTAIGFQLLSSGLMALSWPLARREGANFLRWLPIVGSVTLMVMITFVSAVNMSELERATFWRKHTIQVILRSQAFEENFIDLQRGVRGYVTLGDAGALESYKASLRLEPPLFDELVGLTIDNPSQQRRLRELAAAMDGALAYDRRMVALFDEQGVLAARTADAAGESRVVFANVRDIVRAFSQEERGLLDLRDALEKAEVHGGGRLLIFGSALAALLLLLANFIVGREMSERRRVQLEREKLIGELQRALEEVRTLSGMIPICGWCKSIRSDKGYWQSVEHYVLAHTEATFTHSICPSCAEKFAAELGGLSAQTA